MSPSIFFMNLLDSYSVRLEVPSIATYQRLRVDAGLSAKSDEAARRRLAGTLFAVQIIFADEAVDMGRVISDGGSFLLRSIKAKSLRLHRSYKKQIPRKSFSG